MRLTRHFFDWLLVLAWWAAFGIFALYWLLSGWIGWATSFVAWTAVAAVLLLATNAWLRRAARSGVLLRDGLGWGWLVVLVLAGGSQALTLWPWPVLRLPGSAETALMWLLLGYEAVVAAVLTYRSSRRLLIVQPRASAA